MVVLEVWREYYGKLQRLGLFEGAEGEAPTFSYLDDYANNPNAQAISLSLPLSSEAYSSEEYKGFFEGLVPEGRVRTELAHRFRISPSDYLGILRHLENESIGALVFRNPEGSIAEANNPDYITLDEATLMNLVEFPVRTSADLAEKGRFSLAGAQAKIGVYIDESEASFSSTPGQNLLEKCFLPQGTAPSTHILKIPDADFSDLPANEAFCLSIARNCGLEVAEAWVCSIDGTQVFVSKRFDRLIKDEAMRIGEMLRPLRLHQEDFCQALGVPSYRKYEIEQSGNYVALIARLLERTSTHVIEDKKAFARQIVFDYLIGNCDNHIKNYSLLYSPDWNARRLAPAYDIVCTTILGYSREMGISIGDNRVIDDITRTDWNLFSEDLRIPYKTVVEIMNDIITRFKAVDIGVKTKGLPESFKEVANRVMADASTRFEKLERCAL